MNRSDLIDDDLRDIDPAIAEELGALAIRRKESEILDTLYCSNGASAVSDPFYNLTSDQLLAQFEEAKVKFDALRRQELRSFSDAIEQMGPCPKCGHKITLRREFGDAVVLCQTIYRALITDPRFIRVYKDTPPIGRLRLEPFACEPRAPLQ